MDTHRLRWSHIISSRSLHIWPLTAFNDMIFPIRHHDCWYREDGPENGTLARSCTFYWYCWSSNTYVESRMCKYKRILQCVFTMLYISSTVIQGCVKIYRIVLPKRNSALRVGFFVGFFWWSHQTWGKIPMDCGGDLRKSPGTYLFKRAYYYKNWVRTQNSRIPGGVFWGPFWSRKWAILVKYGILPSTSINNGDLMVILVKNPLLMVIVHEI